MTTITTTAPADAPAIIENTTIWICHIDGVNFSVAADTPETQIRETLSMQYPGARDAQITYDTVMIAGQQHKRLLFTKRGGTKGCAVAELVRLLSRVPPVPIRLVRRAGCADQLLRGTLTFDELIAAIPVDAAGEIVDMPQETPLCQHLAALPPVASVPMTGTSHT